MDRRIAKTRKSIFDAFILLLNKKSFESITVSEIADIADINRVTIYKHFTDKYDVLDQCIDEQLFSLFDGCGTGAMEDLTFQTFDYLHRNHRTLNLLLKAAGAGALHERFARAFQGNTHLQEISTGDTKLYTEIKTQYMISALAGVFEWWLTASEKYTAEEACNTFLNILSEFFPNDKTLEA